MASLRTESMFLISQISLPNTLEKGFLLVIFTEWNVDCIWAVTVDKLIKLSVGCNEGTEYHCLPNSPRTIRALQVQRLKKK